MLIKMEPVLSLAGNLFFPEIVYHLESLLILASCSLFIPVLEILLKELFYRRKAKRGFLFRKAPHSYTGGCLQQELQEATDQPRVLICRADNSHAVVAGLLNLKSAVKPQTSFRFINAKEKINVKLLGCVVLASVVISVFFFFPCITGTGGWRGIF